MGGNQKKAAQQRPKRNGFLACFGIASKRNKTGGSSESWFKLCMPKIKIIIIRRRKGKGKGKGKGRYDGKTVDALKACQSIIKLEANKMEQVKMRNKEVTNDAIPVILIESNEEQSDLKSIRGHQSDENREQMRNSRVRKDSLIGVWMMAITLIIMGFWGYLYAIICMSASLYCLPLIRMVILKKKMVIQRDDNDNDNDNGIGVS